MLQRHDTRASNRSNIVSCPYAYAFRNFRTAQKLKARGGALTANFYFCRLRFASCVGFGKVTVGELSNQLDKFNGLGSSGSRSDQCNSFFPQTFGWIWRLGIFLLLLLLLQQQNDEGQTEGYDGRYPVLVELVAGNFSFLSCIHHTQ